ncbi:MAG: thiamine-monophosphate kinase [Candidatus Nanopelagicales bacterium]
MSAEGSLADLGERKIFSTLLAPTYSAEAGFGDDCADIGGGLVVTTDTCPTPLLEQLGEQDPYTAGWLLATINLSDLAAAGATPEVLVVNYTLPPDTPVHDLQEIIRGVNECAAYHGARVVGGDTRDGRERHLTATAIGRTLPRRVRRGHPSGGKIGRRGARAGDVLLLVGDPGYLWAAALIHHGYAEVAPAVAERIFARARRPIAQVTAGRLLAEHGYTRAALDLSDGLYAGVRILAETNRLGAHMEPKIDLDPVLVEVSAAAHVTTFQLGQNWGDWCLLVAVSRKNAAAAERLLRDRGIGVRQVGRLTREEGKLLVGPRGGEEPWVGVEQERFSPTSWHGDGIEAHLRLMQERSGLHRPSGRI